MRRIKKESGLKYQTTYTLRCVVCDLEFEGTKKTRKYCKSCLAKMNKGLNDVVTNNYIYSKHNYRVSIWEHRVIAENLLGRKLKTNEVVHHIDCNPKNNSIHNLIVLSRGKHTSLHRYLKLQNIATDVHVGEGHWENLIYPSTLNWLSTNNVKFIALWEQSGWVAQLGEARS